MSLRVAEELGCKQSVRRDCQGCGPAGHERQPTNDWLPKRARIMNSACRLCHLRDRFYLCVSCRRHSPSRIAARALGGLNVRDRQGEIDADSESQDTRYGKDDLGKQLGRRPTQACRNF